MSYIATNLLNIVNEWTDASDHGSGVSVRCLDYYEGFQLCATLLNDEKFCMCSWNYEWQ